ACLAWPPNHWKALRASRQAQAGTERALNLASVRKLRLSHGVSAADTHARAEKRESALADLVVRAGVVDLRVAALVGHGVVQADDADLFVDLVEVDLVVRAADVDVGACALDRQGVVGATDVERLPVGTVDVGGGAERPVVDR